MFKKCYVNKDNKFRFENFIFVISEDIEQYKVTDREDIYDMDIIVVRNSNGNMKFYDANFNNVPNQYINPA